MMADELSRARAAVRRASESVDDAAIREHLRSIDEGLREMTSASDSGDARTSGDEPHGENLEEIESKLAGVLSETDGQTHDQLQMARDEIDAYRRTTTRDW